MKDIRHSYRFRGYKLYWLRDSFWFILMIAAVFVLLRFVVGLSAVSGASMEPALRDGDIVVYLRPARELKTGDIAAVRIPSGEYHIKRVAATGGSMVDIYDGRLYVDGREAAQSYASGDTDRSAGAVLYPYEVREGNYFMLGDNRKDSVDSRFYGEVNRRQIRGRVILVISRGGIRTL